jgi:uncharacterized protein YidB (DUF937 family)
MTLLEELVGGLAAEVPAAAGQRSRKLIDGVLELLAAPSSGGLAGFAELFEKSGLSAQASSWIGTGRNQPISPADLTRALGAGRIDALAARGDVGADDASALLAQLVPVLVDKLTPAGRVPAQSDLAALLGAGRMGGAAMAGDKPRADFSNVKAGSSSTAPAPAKPDAQTYTVKAGDSLSKIAKKLYGDATLWRKIFDANTDQIKNPDLIHPGQVLKIPAA